VPSVEKLDGTRLEQGTRLFNQGEIEPALKMLDAAALDGGDAGTLEKVHLLRAQCFAARQDFARAEEAFALALDANPEASLDPAKVDPTLVKMLEAVRARLTGTLVVGSSPAGATLLLDGKSAGFTPQTLQVSVGKHRLEARWGEGSLTGTDVQLRPRREVRVEWVQGAAQMVTLAPDGPEARKVSPYGDFRFAPEISPSPSIDPTLPLELGGGFEFFYFRAGLGVRLFPQLGLTPRFAFSLPVLERVAVALEVGVPFEFFSSSVAIGLNGGAGVEFYPLRWFGAFVLVGGRHYFLRPGNDGTAFTATAGIRLRVP
jgi:PEGA domain